MSEWYKPKREDMEISEDRTTLEVYVKTNNFGNVYVDIPIKYILEVLKIERINK